METFLISQLRHSGTCHGRFLEICLNIPLNVSQSFIELTLHNLGYRWLGVKQYSEIHLYKNIMCRTWFIFVMIPPNALL